jgi:hypothetical protein
MVLKARDYGFIGLKLKDLIFCESDESTWALHIHWLEGTVAA